MDRGHGGGTGRGPRPGSQASWAWWWHRSWPQTGEPGIVGMVVAPVAAPDRKARHRGHGGSGELGIVGMAAPKSEEAYDFEGPNSGQHFYQYVICNMLLKFAPCALCREGLDVLVSGEVRC